MSHELKEGAQLRCIWWADGSLTVGVQVDSIIVVEQMGQMGMVPWVEVVSNGKASLYNCALLEGVQPVMTKQEKELVT